MDMRVDFPDPDAPMMATNDPRSTVRSMPLSATTSTSPTVNVRTRFSTLTMGPCIWFLAVTRKSSGLRRAGGGAIGRCTPFPDDHRIPRLDVAADDLGIGIILKTGRDIAQRRLAI